jgi:hypothetical protein
MPDALGFTVIFATHGHTLRGRDVTSSEDEALPYLLDDERRAIVLATILEVCDYRGWEPLAVHVRSNAVYAVMDADASSERVLKDFKAYCGRKLVKNLREPRSIQRWASGGSAFHCFEKKELRWEIDHVLQGLGEPMNVYDASKAPE